jgi:RNA polymerase sigma-70 factor (ECF subfamily)
VLLKLIGGMKAFEYESQKGKFRSWLKTVATNVSTDVLRSFRERGSGDSQFGSLLEDASLAAATESLHAQLDEAYQQELFLQARDRVQARVQASTWDAYIATCEEQRPATDVALQMKMSMSQVYVAKHRVLKLLKEEVAKLTHE